MNNPITGFIATLPIIIAAWTPSVATIAAPPAQFSAQLNGKEDGNEQRKLWAAISANHLVLDSPPTRHAFMMHFALVNDGKTTVSPHITDSQLVVNGVELKDWPQTIGNGPRDGRWESLPPGECISFAYALGDHFKKPGSYVVMWKGKGFRSREIEIRVLSKKKGKKSLTHANRPQDDAIDQLVQKLNSQGGLWLNGLTPRIEIPSDSKPEQVIAQAVEKTEFEHGRIKNYRTLTVRPVELNTAGVNSPRVALIETDLGTKMLLFFPFQNDDWWTRFYDADQK